ncbi:MAG: multiheme c-type cytochrome [Labilithrix sp.]
MVRWVGLAFLIAACARSESPTPVQNPPPPPKPAEPLLPVAGQGTLAPSLMKVLNPHEKMGDQIADVEGCASCHSDVAPQWRKSAHAFASFNNPVYRVGVEKIRHDRDRQTSQFCGGCHDIALMVDGAMLGEIEPTDLRAHAGVTCNTCHGIANARADGNGSYDLDLSPVPIPKEGDAASSEAHRKRVGQTALRTAAMCSTCHKAFLDPSTGNAAHLVGQDDATPWARSPFAGSDAARIDDEVAQQECRSCHMPRVPAVNGDPGAKKGTVASHYFLGAHTWLASMQNDPELVERVQTFMQKRVSLDIGGTRPAELAPGQSVTIDVVVRNLDVGHRFPGGVMDAQDTWIEVVVEDAQGKRVADAGFDDDSRHVLTSYMAHQDGTRALVRETHEFRAGVWNHTIAPRDAAVVGYSLDVPEGAKLPLKATARLRHRSRGTALQKVACDDYRSPRGQEFGKVGLAKVARAIDACKPQPITVLGVATASLGQRREESRHEAYARNVAYGLGLSHALQERLDEARLPYMAALELAETPREQAIALGGLALVASRQGRVDETFGLAARADALVGVTPAMQHARAEVLASTWRLQEAAPLFLDVARRAPRDDSAWAAAAMTFGGAGDPASALDAARSGLALQPRDGDMLRIQSLAIPGSAPAQEAFLDRRTPDDAPGIRGKCSKNVRGCANERVPAHTHVMRQPGTN